MPNQSLVEAARTLVRSLASTENKGTNLKKLIDDAFKEIADQTICDLSILEDCIKGYTGSTALVEPPKISPPKTVARRRGEKRRRAQSDDEKEIRGIVSDPDQVVDFAKN